MLHHFRADAYQANLTEEADVDEKADLCNENSSSQELVLIALTLPLWTFITIYLLFLLIHYLRKIQYFTLYDRCSPKNAHFRYDFHIIIGRHATNYSVNESHLILDLLDNQLISAFTIQVPGLTMFNQNQVFTYRHSRQKLRCINFTIFRRHPIKDVCSIRVAHSCSSPDSRLFVYGVSLYDATNSESKFFPITTVVKYRGTQWALNTTFEPKSELNFSKIGCDCYDPFGTSSWPSYMDTLILVFYLWCSVFCFGHLITVEAILNSVAIHAFTVSFISGTSAAVIAFVYLKFIKTHIVDQHYESTTWMLVKSAFVAAVLVLSLAFWTLATRQTRSCMKPATDWLISSIGSGAILTAILLLTLYIMKRSKMNRDNATLDENDAALMKTNSRPSIEFSYDVGSARRDNLQPTGQFTAATKKLTNSKSGKTAKKGSKKKSKRNASAGSGANKQENKVALKDNTATTNNNNNNNNNNDKNDETLDTAFNTGSAYMKARNRNSISQYI